MKKVANCKVCKDRTICTAPCDAVAKMLSRSHIKNKELTIGDPVYSKNDWPSFEKIKHLQPMEIIYLTLEACRIPRDLVAKALGIKRSYLRWVISMAKKKLSGDTTP